MIRVMMREFFIWIDESYTIFGMVDRAGEQPGPGHPVAKEFLMKYGDRSCQEVDLGVPRWKEDPGYVVGLIKSYIDNKSYEVGGLIMETGGSISHGSVVQENTAFRQ